MKSLRRRLDLLRRDPQTVVVFEGAPVRWEGEEITEGELRRRIAASPFDVEIIRVIFEDERAT